MKAILLVCLLSAVVAEEAILKYHEQVGIPVAARIRQQESMRITGGYASYTGEHPFMAGLVITLTTGDVSVCGGSLLSPYRVLTTARCWYDGYYQGRSVQVVLGSIKLFSGGTRVFATAIANHPYFNPYTFANDIAMLTVPYISYNSNVKPILLPYGIGISFEGYLSVVIGYGKTSDSASLNKGQSLRDNFVAVISNRDCNQIYGSTITGSVMCTSGAYGNGACPGDYGGPLIMRRYPRTNNQDLLIGLVSFTAAAGCQAGLPTGYTRVNSHIVWISSQL